MYLLINNKHYPLTRRIVKENSIEFLSVMEEPENYGEIIPMYSDDDFLLSEDVVADYKYIRYKKYALVLTNEEELPKPVQPTYTQEQRREYAYKFDKMIEYGDGRYTVDEARDLYYKYLIDDESKSGICEELKSLIKQAKAVIREKYPDEVTE